MVAADVAGRLVRRAPQAESTPASPPTHSNAPLPSITSLPNVLPFVTSEWEFPTTSLPAIPTRKAQDSSSLLSSPGTVAGICVSIAVVCLAFSGYLVWRIKYRNKPHPEAPASVAPSSGRFGVIKLPPSPNVPRFQGTSSRPTISPYPQSQLSSMSATGSHHTLTQKQGGALAIYVREMHYEEGAPLPSPDPATPSAHGFELKERPLTASPPYRLADPSLNNTSVTSLGISLGQSTLHPSQAQTIFTKNALPLHSPPPYATVHSRATTPSMLLSTHSHSRTSTPSFMSQRGTPLPSPSFEKGFERTHPSHSEAAEITHPDNQEYPARDSGFSETPTAVEPSGYRASAVPSNAQTLINSPPLRITSFTSDPFNAHQYEIPSWLAADPYARSQRDPPGAGSASIYSGRLRSAAASSRLLPSDTSLRSLTPEPEELTGDDALDPPLAHSPSPYPFADILESSLENAVEEPPSRSLTTPSPIAVYPFATSRRHRPRFRLDHFEAEAVHPRYSTTGAAPPSSFAPHNNRASIASVTRAGSLNRNGSLIKSGSRRGRFSREVPGRTPVTNEAHLRSLIEDLPWLDMDPFESQGRRLSTGAASSYLLPSERGSMYSLSPEPVLRGSRRVSLEPLSPSSHSPTLNNAPQPSFVSTVQKDLGEEGTLWTQMESEPQPVNH